MESDNLLLLSLNVTEMRVLIALRHLAASNGKVQVTMEELGILTDYSREGIRRGLRGLEERGIIETSRTKRNLGRLYKNEYQLLHNSVQTVHKSVASDVEVDKNLPVEVHEFVASTASTKVLSTVQLQKVKNTSYSLGAESPVEDFKEVKVVNKWQDDDEGVGGWGLLEGEKPASAPKVSKRDPKTRWQRPQEEWTAADVASEFAYRVYDRVRGIPGLVSTKDLRGALAANRSRFGVSATLEMELLEKFFGDERNMLAIKNSPRKAHGIFLNFITANINSVTEEMGMDEPEVDKNVAVDYVYASDGKKFDNSMPGRKALENYEKKLGANNG